MTTILMCRLFEYNILMSHTTYDIIIRIGFQYNFCKKKKIITLTMEYNTCYNIIVHTRTHTTT